MKQELWKRFIYQMNTAHDHTIVALCHQCPYATKTEIFEPRIDPNKSPGLHESFYALVDRSTLKPTLDDKACNSCFESWVEDRKDEGKICIKCGDWIIGGKAKAAMRIDTKSVWDDGFTITKYHSICEGCLLQGKTVDEWARDVVAKSKAVGLHTESN